MYENVLWDNDAVHYVEVINVMKEKPFQAECVRLRVDGYKMMLLDTNGNTHTFDFEDDEIPMFYTIDLSVPEDEKNEPEYKVTLKSRHYFDPITLTLDCISYKRIGYMGDPYFIVIQVSRKYAKCYSTRYFEIIGVEKIKRKLKRKRKKS